MNDDPELKRGDAYLLIAAAVLLCLCFLGGGDSAQANLGMLAAQLMAIPILLFAVIRRDSSERLVSARMAVVAAAMIALVPLLQMLPLPWSLWKLPTERISLWRDLNAAGVSALDLRWSLSPAATERDFYFLLPGLALFFCMLSVGRAAWRRMLGLVVVLCVANLAFAFAQVAAGQQSFLNPYPEFAPNMGGVFANRNHQADMLAIGLMLVTVFLVNAWRYARESGRLGGKPGILVLIALILMAALPLIGSRAGVIIAMVMLAGVLLSAGLPSMRTFRESRLLQFGSALALLAFVVGLHAALAWMKSDAGEAVVDGSRYRISRETLAIGIEHAPLGAGAGTFVAAFQQGSSDDFLMGAYINNAHNEYAQWWLEGGVLGVCVVLLTLLVFVLTLIKLLRKRPGSPARVYGMAAMMGIGVIVLHSIVDYPLRTQALMAVFSVLSGVAVAAAGTGASSKSQSARHR